MTLILLFSSAQSYSHFERSDPYQALLKLHNISHFSIWNNSRTDFVKLKSLGLPSHLLDLKEIPMRNFLRETGIYTSVDFDSAEIIGKHLTNDHDFERVNDKHSPSDGEDIEMSAILNEQNVIDELEGRQTSFKRTDATLA